VKFGLDLFRKALSTVDTSRGWWTIIRESFTGAWQRNVDISIEDLSKSPIVYACMTLISNDFGKLRQQLVESDSDGIWRVVGQSPFWPVLRKPNRYQNHIQFKQWWMMSKLRFGNTYALKERDKRGIVVRLYILDACRVTPLVADDGSIFYRLSQDNLSGISETDITVPASEIIHDRMNCMYHPLVGISPLYAAAIAAGIGIKIQNNALHFFANNARPSGILIAPGNISPENATALKEQWQSGYAGENRGKVAILGDGMKFEPTATDAVDSELIKTLQWSDERVCSVFHVPAYKVGVGQPPTYNNIEALDRAYYSSCLQSPIEEYEACMDDGLGLDGVKVGVELDLDGLMRMDSKTQMETIKAGIEAKVLTVNDGRKRLNHGPLSGGDTVYMQQQDLPLDQVKDNKVAPVAPPAPPDDEEPDEQVRQFTDLLVKRLTHAARA
jgi:HK97 family phage portal protein